MIQATFLVILACFSASIAETIAPPQVTNWGAWGDLERCIGPNFATGFQLKSQTWTGVLDDTALNGIKLYCGDPIHENVVTSSVGAFGQWRNSYRCAEGDFITGFQLRVEPASILTVDETATNNARFYCGWNTTAFIEGDGEGWGKWGQAVHCAQQHVVCGIETQVEKDRGIFVDDTALNNVKMECCPLD